MRIAAVVCSMFVVCGGVAAVRADIVPLQPFTGELSEPLDFPAGQFGVTIVAALPIFSGAMIVTTPLFPITAVHYLFQNSLSGDVVTPRTGGHFLGTTQGPQEWQFPTPIRRIGSYFNNNSGADDATIEFFGLGGVSLGTRVATIPAPGNVWTWNGWESDVPITKMIMRGNGALNGFLWMDDLELTLVPGPGTGAAAALALGLLGGRPRRIRSR